jgi:hypothetical protein
MRKLVVTETEILDSEKYNSYDEKDIQKVGDIFDICSFYNQGSYWVGSKEDGNFLRMKLEDQTDIEWQNIPREFKITYKNKFDKDCEELFSDEYCMHMRVEEIMGKGIKEVCYDVRQLDLTKESKLNNGWIIVK